MPQKWGTYLRALLSSHQMSMHSKCMHTHLFTPTHTLRETFRHKEGRTQTLAFVSVSGSYSLLKCFVTCIRVGGN